jgi:hypothetical protein
MGPAITTLVVYNEVALTTLTAAKNKLLLVLLLAYPFAASAACDPTGTYSRGARDAHADSFEVRRAGDKYELQLSAYGQKLADGTWTGGAIRGEFELSEHGCASAYLNPGEECAIFILFNRSAVAHQFGSCHFGAGVRAGGTYRRLSARGGQVSFTRSPGAIPEASTHANR